MNVFTDYKKERRIINHNGHRLTIIKSTDVYGNCGFKPVGKLTCAYIDNLSDDERNKFWDEIEW